MKVINVQEAKTHLSRLIDQVAAGECVLLGKHGKPLAKLSPYAPQSEVRPLGGYEGQIQIAPDFDAEDERIRLLFAAG
ncbi:MAG: type II toxin-antitoxin system prevent-host-death family antitoxin [Chthoniobacterales bacterium]